MHCHQGAAHREAEALHGPSAMRSVDWREHGEFKLSILDQSPVNDTETATDAFQHTIELAQKAEAWGYHRFWVSEHHGSDRVMGSSPEVLISHLLAKTTRIRVGSGGVMLQHYSPYKVAENFNVLASLAPGRVDLGIGRGPGGLPRSTRALQQEMGARPSHSPRNCWNWSNSSTINWRKTIHSTD